MIQNGVSAFGLRRSNFPVLLDESTFSWTIVHARSFAPSGFFKWKKSWHV